MPACLTEAQHLTRPEYRSDMRENDTAPFRIRDIPVALALLTRLPVPKLRDEAFQRQAQAVWAFPLVGLVVGAIAASAAALALAAGLPGALAAGVFLALQMILTGAMHEDGLADTADGFWGGWSVERRLEIMKDSHIGTYGVLALVMSVGLRWLAISLVLASSIWLLIAIAVASRLGLPAMMSALPRVRPGGLSDHVGTPPVLAAALSAGLGFMLLILIAGPATAPLILATCLAVAFCAPIARAKIGGQTGDVLGATQQVTEIACLVMLAAMT